MITSEKKADRAHDGLESRNAVETAIAAAKGGRETTWEGAAIRVRRTIRPWESRVRPQPGSESRDPGSDEPL